METAESEEELEDRPGLACSFLHNNLFSQVLVYSFILLILFYYYTVSAPVP